MSISPSTLEAAMARGISSSPFQVTGIPVMFSHLSEATLPEVQEMDVALKEGSQTHHSALPRGQHLGPSEHELPKPDGQISLPIHVPGRFAQVVRGIYRSSFPQTGHLDIFKVLGIKSIVRFVDEEYSPTVKAFIGINNVRVVCIPIIPNKDATITVADQTVSKVMNILMNYGNHPLVLHCNQGKHRTGCMVGCLRKLQGWSHPWIVEEYRSFAGRKARVLDEAFIEAYNPSRAVQKTAVRLNIKSWARVPDQLSQNADVEPVPPSQ